MFFNYIKEIKNRFCLIVLAWVLTFLFSYVYKETLLFLCLKPSLHYFQESSFYFISTNLTEIFYTYLNLMYFISNNFAFILIIYHLVLFITPGLTKLEYNKLKLLIFMSFLIWLFFLLFLNNYFLNFCWSFFLSFQNTNETSINFYFEAKFNEYLIFYLLFYKFCLICVFIFILILIILEIYNKKLLINVRKFFYFSFFLLATMLTPPDVFSQIFFSFIFIMLFEILIYSSFLTKNFNIFKVTN